MPFNDAGMPCGFGKKRIFDSPTQLHSLIEEYFKMCDSRQEIVTDSKGNTKLIKKPYTISGICVYLGISKDAWRAYANREGYEATIKEAKTNCENFIEENMLTGACNTIGAIFSLKNNNDWADKQEIKTTNTQESSLSDLSNEELEAKLLELGYTKNK